MACSRAGTQLLSILAPGSTSPATPTTGSPGCGLLLHCQGYIPSVGKGEDGTEMANNSWIIDAGTLEMRTCPEGSCLSWETSSASSICEL